MNTTIIKGEALFSQLADEWDALVTASMTNTPFQLLAYQKSWWGHLQPEESELISVVVRRPDGTLAGIAPFYLQSGVLYLNGSKEETDYLDMIVRLDEAGAVWTAVFSAITAPDFPQWQTLDLWNLPAESISRSVVADLAQQQGWTAEETLAEVCPIIPLPDSFEAYLDQIDSKQRRELNRKLRRAKGLDVKLVQIEAEDELEEAVNLFLELLQKSMYEKRDWLTNGRRALFHDTARAALKGGYLQLLFTEVNGEKASTLFNFNYDGRIWVYNSGLDPNSYSKMSLGVVISALAIEKGIEQECTTFDFLRGDETYKYRFGAEDSQIFRLMVTR